MPITPTGLPVAVTREETLYAVLNAMHLGLGLHVLWAYPEGYPGDGAMTFGLFFAIGAVAAMTCGLWRAWRRSPMRRRWATSAQLENPQRKGFRRPSNIKRISLDDPDHRIRELYLGHERDRRKGRFHPVVTADDEAHVAVIAPQRVGKTTGYFVPALLSTGRTVIATASKAVEIPATVLHRVKVARETGGRVFILNLNRAPLPDLPEGVVECRHDPVAGCEDTTYCLGVVRAWRAVQGGGHAYPSAAGGGGTESSSGAFFQDSAEAIVAVYFHAAALAGGGVTQVTAWLRSLAVDEPCRIIRPARNSARVV